MDTITTILATTTQNKWQVFQMDVKSTFLNGILQEEVYVDQPPGFKVKGREDKVYKMKKWFYGLKQAPRDWYIRIDSYFINNWFGVSNNETTLYTKTNQEGKIIIVCLYVDDMIYIGNLMLEEFKFSLKIYFEMENLCLMKYFLGIEVDQYCHCVFVYKKTYATGILKRFKIDKCKPTKPPI